MDKNCFAMTPPMGWNSYDYYDTTVTEEQVMANAAYMAKHLKEYGYEYVVVDIEWYSNDAGTRRKEYQYIPFGDDAIDSYGRFQPSPIRFPSSANGAGFTKLAEYVHSLSLKFGIHIMRGIPRTAAENHMPIFGTSYTANMAANPSSICGWNPDMYGVLDNEAGQAYYDNLIQMYADWGVDFIKCDDICDSWMYRGDHFSGWHETRMIHDAIQKTGREIVLSLSPGPAHIDRAWQYCQYANMWRITDDFWDDWKSLKNMFYRCELWQDHVKAGCFPDCDMLALGKLGKGFEDGERECRFTKDEQKTMMTLWGIFRSPLMIGAELTKLDDFTLSILTNQELIKMSKEETAPKQMRRTEKEAIWVKKSLEDGKIYLALFNLSDEDREVSVAIQKLRENELFPNERSEEISENSLDKDCKDAFENIIDVWEQETLKASNVVRDGKIVATLPAHGSVLYTLKFL